MSAYLYTYACHEDEQSLCSLEFRSLFGFAPATNAFISAREIDASRSPFIKERVDILYEGTDLSDLADQVRDLQLRGSTFKVQFVKTGEDVPYEERLWAERKMGQQIVGKADMRTPEIPFGLAKIDDRWLFGYVHENQAVWLKHKSKAQNYSTALSTRVARAIANIAVPDPLGVKVIDPCCGIGTVVIEALSLGMDVVGYDNNWLAVRGARANLQHLGFPNVVKVADMRMLTGRYDAAIIDLPYNLCSKLPQEEQEEMLQSARRLADKVVVISTEAVDTVVEGIGFTIVDRCFVKKQAFVREVLVCIL